MSEETQDETTEPVKIEKYGIVIDHGVVRVVDDAELTIAEFSSSTRLMAASALVEQLNAGAAEIVTPESFLKQTLPAQAARQRLEGFLADVRSTEDLILERIRQDTVLLDRAVKLFERVQERLSATETAQNGSAQGEDTPELLSEPEGPAAGLKYHSPAGLLGMFQPGPY